MPSGPISDPERFRRARELFGAALERSPGERRAFLEEACGGDEELRAEVLSLLAAHGEAGDFLAGPALADAGEDPLVGRGIGPYRLIGRLGGGGMGAVYLAVRSDEAYHKRVAVKVLKPGMDSEEILRRFATERQILAGLDHPCIARLLDGGTTPEGRPYLVMEYVEGEPITRWCDARRLSTRQRLELFRDVCSAVHFAHQNLVVHRDLKPGNVLVGDDGVPKLLDFGIAKLLNPELAGAALAPTRPTGRLLTPDYASPEQVQGERVTTASDVYSLGVMLYELLSGHHPYRGRATSPGELERAVTALEPERPSLAVMRREEVAGPAGEEVLDPAAVSRTREGEPARLRRALAGDVDHIVLKALRKEPAYRYASAEQMGEDIRRHLVGLPVLARRGKVAYRLGKFVRRHRLEVAATAALVAAAIAFGVLMAVQRDAVAAERDRAEAERRRAEEVTSFLVELFEGADPFGEPGGELTARELLEHGVRRLASELGDQPATRAELAATLGGINQRLGRYQEARPLLEEALALRRRTLGENHPQVAASLYDLAVLELAEGDYDAAEALLREALARQRASPEGDPLALGKTLSALGNLQFDRGDAAAAAALSAEALELRRRHLGERHRDVAESLQDLAAAVWRNGDPDRAEDLYRRALRLHRRLLGNDHPMVAANLNNLAVLLQARGADREAEALYREALEIRRRRLGEGHPELANSLYRLADLLVEQGEHAAAEPAAAEARAILAGALPPGDWRTALAASLHGTCIARLGRFAEAEPLLLAAHADLETARGGDDRSTRETARRLAELYAAWGRPVEAERWRYAAGAPP